MKMLDKICINAMLRANVAKDKLESFLEEQDGVSNVVATLLILVIVVTLVPHSGADFQSGLTV